MKTLMTIGLVILFGSGLATAGEGPCAKIRKACEAAGFVKGGAKTGKGLRKDCMFPISNGQQVAGVTVDPADAASCKASHEQKPAQ